MQHPVLAVIMTYKGQGPSVVCFSSTNLAGHIAHKNSKEDAVYIFLAKLRIICELAIIYSRIFLGSVGKSHVESGCCFFCLCSCSPTGHDFVTVFVAKLRTSSRLLAWRFNTLQVYDLPGIFNAFLSPNVAFFPAVSTHCRYLLGIVLIAAMVRCFDSTIF